MNTMEDLINSLDNHSALHTVAAIAAGYETPLIDSEGLRKHVSAIQAFADAEELERLLAARHKEVTRAVEARRRVVGHHTIGGVRVPVVSFD